MQCGGGGVRVCGGVVCNIFMFRCILYIKYTSKHENENTFTMSSESAHTFREKPPIYRENASYLPGSQSYHHHCRDFTTDNMSQ